MSRRLTAEELSEPDVTVMIPYAKLERLPAEVRQYLELYIPKDNGKQLIYTLPAYLVRELEQMAAAGATVATSEPQAAPALADHSAGQAPHWQQMSLF